MFLPLTPIRFLHRAQDLYGHKIGVICGDRQFTYAEFAGRAERLATGLAGLGIGEGDRVAYLSFNNHRLLEGYYGVVQAKAILMPLNVRLTPEELKQILAHSGARALLFETDFAPVVEQLKAACPDLERLVCLEGPHPLAELSYEEILEQGRPERADIFAYHENSVAELFYTSGSTGTPKGVTLSHRTLYLHALGAAISQAQYGYGDDAVDLHTIPLFHANGWGKAQVAVMLGARHVMVRRFEPAAVFQLVERHRATHMSLVPTMANALLNSPDAARHDLSSLRMIMLGGAASSPELVERLEKQFGCSAVGGYGLTETAPVLTLACRKSTIQPASDAERYRLQAMTGMAIPNVELRVVDVNGQDVPPDGKSIGEIVTRSDHVMEGYFKDPEGTAAVMDNGWFHTGDMAVWDEEGFVLIMDRKKDIIISGGENISSIEIEKAIAAHPEVYECVVVAAPHETWGETPAAIVYGKPGSNLTAEALLEYLDGRLARYKLPRHIEFTDQPLPKGGTGKVKKLALREKFWAGKEKRVQG